MKMISCETFVDYVIDFFPDHMKQVKEKPELLGWCVGQVMKMSNGAADPQETKEQFIRKLDLTIEI